MVSGLVGEPRIHYMLKKGLRGDVKAFYKVLNILWRYNNHPIIKYVCYALVYQYVMNNVVDLENECKTCGGICCKRGGLIPIYEFDLKELKELLGDKVYNVVKTVNGEYYLERPCVFQADWKCTVHRVKPYACLSYPFATEDEQVKYMEIYNGIGIPDVHAPSNCRAAVKVKEYVYNMALDFIDKYSREPSPKELLDTVLHSLLR